MRVLLIYIVVLGLGSIGMISIVNKSSNPESIILGEWSEVSWEYEKSDKPIANGMDKRYLSEYVKNVTGQNLVIHEAETWTFMPNGKLILTGKDLNKTVKWSIKGRGHLLQLKYDDNETEHYNITELSRDKLILNFEADAQARGIARLTFDKK